MSGARAWRRPEPSASGERVLVNGAYGSPRWIRIRRARFIAVSSRNFPRRHRVEETPDLPRTNCRCDCRRRRGSCCLSGIARDRPAGGSTPGGVRRHPRRGSPRGVARPRRAVERYSGRLRRKSATSAKRLSRKARTSASTEGWSSAAFMHRSQASRRSIPIETPACRMRRRGCPWACE